MIHASFSFLLAVAIDIYELIFSFYVVLQSRLMYSVISMFLPWFLFCATFTANDDDINVVSRSVSYLYQFQCNCQATYIFEPERQLGTQVLEHVSVHG